MHNIETNRASWAQVKEKECAAAKVGQNCIPRGFQCQIQKLGREAMAKQKDSFF